MNDGDRQSCVVVQGCAQNRRDPLYLFLCYAEWREQRNIKSYEELLAALDDCDEGIRTFAESLLRRASPRPPAVRASGMSTARLDEQESSASGLVRPSPAEPPRRKTRLQSST